VKQELIGRGGKNKIDVTIVWAPMMESDDEASARESAKMFDGTRVTQFYDPERLVGSAFRQQVFPDAYQQALASLPDDHWMREALLDYGPDYGNRPEWDIYMFFDRNAAWGDSAPRPSHFIRHLGRVIETDKERLSLMWIDSYSNAPVEGDLREQIAKAYRKPQESR
jgi:hypothetical protein